MKKSILIAFSVLITGVFMLISCSKEENSKIESGDIQVAREETMASNIFDDAFVQANNAFSAKNSEINNTKSASIPGAAEKDSVIITIDNTDPATWPKTITIDFGTGVTSNNIERKGKILVTVDGSYGLAGTSWIITFDGYEYNGYKVEGTKTVIFEGTNDLQQLYFSISVKNAKITWPDGKKFTWNSERQRTWTNVALLNPYDNTFEITGTANGVNTDGVAYSISITSPLLVSPGCNNIKQGTLVISTEGNPDVTLDYGDGTCDNMATISVGNASKEIQL